MPNENRVKEARAAESIRNAAARIMREPADREAKPELS